MISKKQNIDNPNLVHFTGDNSLNSPLIQNNTPLNTLQINNINLDAVKNTLPLYNIPTQPGLQLSQIALNSIPGQQMTLASLPNPSPIILPETNMIQDPIPLNPNSGIPLPSISYNIMNPPIKTKSTSILILKSI